MKPKILQYLQSNVIKKVFIILAILLTFFVICNNIIMPWYVNYGGEIIVPSVVGKPFEDAKKILDSVGLEARQGDTRLDSRVPIGCVISQSPVSGKKVNYGRRVYLTISGGDVFVKVPNLKGRSIRDARFQLERDGLKLGSIEYQPSDQFPENTIIDQTIAPGRKVKKDVYISIIVSKGKITDRVEVPDLHGKSLSEAERILNAKGLVIGNKLYIPVADLLPNTIVDQYPRPNELVEVGKSIDIFIVQSGDKKHEIPEH